MISMILQMSGATALYIILTGVVWHLWQKKTDHTLWMKLAVGLFYGLCSIASNHIGINYGAMLLNVRDIGPIAAGLFFDPVSGIVSGLIGGIERYVIGEFFGIGSFTRVACGISTCLAGVLAAALHKWVYAGHRPSVSHSLFLGAVMEVFHMYVVLITHRNQMAMAYAVVQTCALPMIIFTGLGTAGCSAMILRLSGLKGAVHPWTHRRDTPIHVRFQRWLLVVTVGLFAVNSFVTFNLERRMAYQNAEASLRYEAEDFQKRFEEEGDIEIFSAHSADSYISSRGLYYAVDAAKGQAVAGYDLTEPAQVPQEEVNLIKENAGKGAFTMRIARLSSREYLCTSAKLNETYYILVCTPLSSVYNGSQDRIYETLFSEILIFTALYLLIAMLVDRMVVRNLDRVNGSLNRITQGDLEETVTVEESSEFTKLSGDINMTVASLRGYIDAEKKRMEEELRLATTIQESALPRIFHFPRQDFEIYALMNPARQVGGDFYDFFFIDGSHLALVIADVSGKSVPAALFMMRAKTAIKNYARSGNSAAEVLTHANQTLCEGNDAEMFVTVWLGIIDLESGKMQCSNAGHEYPLLMRRGEEYAVYKDRHTLPLAAMEGARMREYEILLQPGDQIFVYTDGIPEANNESGAFYGVERLTAKLNELRGQPQKDILEGVLADIKAFAGKAEQFDDITMVGFSYFGPDRG